jgi:hypothetical protein
MNPNSLYIDSHSSLSETELLTMVIPELNRINKNRKYSPPNPNIKKDNLPTNISTTSPIKFKYTQ